MTFKPLDQNYEKKVRESFSRQYFMNFIGAKLINVRPGYCEIHLPYKKTFLNNMVFSMQDLLAPLPIIREATLLIV